MLYSAKTLPYLGSKIWDLVPCDIRDCATETSFSAKKLKNENHIDVHVDSKWKIYIPNFKIYWLDMCIEMSLVYRLKILWHIFKIYVYAYKTLKFEIYAQLVIF